MRSQEHAAPEIVLGQRRTGGEGSLPCASITVPFTARHSLPLGQLLHSPEVCVSGTEVEVAPRLSSVTCLSTHTSERLGLPVCMPTDACTNFASVDMEGQSDVALTQQDFTSSCSV